MALDLAPCSPNQNILKYLGYLSVTMTYPYLSCRIILNSNTRVLKVLKREGF
jgi:hypothetical protein